jgi:aspartyl-tRNA(Asn)/glutamyl-tRNA(Gln) amidotransferase subunit C
LIVKVTPELVQRLADLAELRLEGDEARGMQRDLEAILGYIEQLSELDTTDVPPTSHVLDVATPMREDRVEQVLPVAEAVRNAPRHDEASMIVPKVLE